MTSEGFRVTKSRGKGAKSHLRELFGLPVPASGLDT